MAMVLPPVAGRVHEGRMGGLQEGSQAAPRATDLPLPFAGKDSMGRGGRVDPFPMRKAEAAHPS